MVNFNQLEITLLIEFCSESKISIIFRGNTLSSTTVISDELLSLLYRPAFSLCIYHTFLIKFATKNGYTIIRLAIG